MINELEKRIARLEVQEVSPALRYDDLVMPATSTKQGSNLKPDFDETNVGYLFPQNDTSEVLYLIYQLPHRWQEGSVIYPHVHFRQTGSATPTFKLAYSWHNVGEAIPSYTTLTMATMVATYTSGSIQQIARSTSGIDGAGKTISSILTCKLYREDNAVTGDVLMYQVDLHILADSHGSRLEYTK